MLFCRASLSAVCLSWGACCAEGSSAEHRALRALLVTHCLSSSYSARIRISSKYLIYGFQLSSVAKQLVVKAYRLRGSPVMVFMGFLSSTFHRPPLLIAASLLWSFPGQEGYTDIFLLGFASCRCIPCSKKANAWFCLRTLLLVAAFFPSSSRRVVTPQALKSVPRRSIFHLILQVKRTNLTIEIELLGGGIKNPPTQQPKLTSSLFLCFSTVNFM